MDQKYGMWKLYDILDIHLLCSMFSTNYEGIN